MTEISVQELSEKLNKQDDLLIIDIREKYEYEWSNIGALNIPMGELLDKLDLIPKDKPVVFHCNTGMKASAMVDVLENKYGFTNLLHLTGGLDAWANEIDPSKKLDA